MTVTDPRPDRPVRWRRRTAVPALAILLAIAAQPISAARAQSLESGPVMDAVRALKAGQFLWAPQLAPNGPMLIIVNRATQRVIVYRNGVPIAVSTVSTGRTGRRTPTGVFTILEKQVTHFSSLYNSAPMPFMERLTWDGVAMHGGTLPGYPASHGCIRLPHEFAKLLYGETRIGTVVVVTDSPELPRFVPAPTLTAPEADVLPVDNQGVTWFPERSPEGPVTVVISAADKRLIVLRNGKQIGGAPVTLAQPVERAAAYTLQARDAITGDRWMRLPLPGQDPANPLTSETAQDVTLPAGVKETIATVLEPGATVLIIPDSLARTLPASGALLESAPDGPLPK
jgi:hypothetical protein